MNLETKPLKSLNRDDIFAIPCGPFLTWKTVVGVYKDGSMLIENTTGEVKLWPAGMVNDQVVKVPIVDMWWEAA